MRDGSIIRGRLWFQGVFLLHYTMILAPFNPFDTHRVPFGTTLSPFAQDRQTSRPLVLWSRQSTSRTQRASSLTLLMELLDLPILSRVPPEESHLGMLLLPNQRVLSAMVSLFILFFSNIVLICLSITVSVK